MKKYTIRLMRLSTIISACFLFANTTLAQYVNIPDATFVSWLNTNGFSGCLNGNQLDTTCPAVINAVSLSCSAVSIRDLTGIQYFKNLQSLDCSNDSLYTLPALPTQLSSLNCNYNNLSSLPAIPSPMRQMQCENNFLTALPALPAGIEFLNCQNNRLASLPALPDSLVVFWATNNQIATLPALPPILQNLVCDQNRLTIIPTLPPMLVGLIVNDNLLTGLPSLPSARLIEINCTNNVLTSLPALPAGLQSLYCDTNSIGTLPALPLSLQTLSCSYNQLDSLPLLHDSLTYINCSYNQISILPVLPSSLSGFYCDSNQLTNLPVLPLNLQSVGCSNNQLVTLPSLPGTLLMLDCSYNLLTSIPALPDSLTYFYCNNNPALTCLPQLKKIYQFIFNNTGITCLTDYGTITWSVPALDTVPLCDVINSGGCQSAWNISGDVYYDANANCQFDTTDVGQDYVKMQLTGGGFQQQIYSSYGGGYSFIGSQGINYTIKPDTTDLPFNVSCPANSVIPVTLIPSDSISANNNFALQCRADGIDVGVRSIINNYIVPRPTTAFTLLAAAGDMSAFYGAHCASGVSGVVELTYNGQITYTGVASGALTPTSVTGNTISWSIADFGTVNNYQSFNAMFVVDSLAVPGTQVCFTMRVTTTATDYDPANNTAYFCLTIVNALDPNEKEVSPAGNIDTTQQWLTYTIRFQNTGSAPALNIRITDTLDNSLDPSTFQLLAYSAKNITQLFGNAVVFNFPNINLPDSLTSDSTSRGYVQYKVKLKSGLPLGTQIQNTAGIYFDLNPAVVTNTAVNTISNTTGVINVTGRNESISINLYPNPAKNYVILETDITAIGATMQLTDVAGREILAQTITNPKTQIPVSSLSAGIYMIKVNSADGRSGVKKLIVE